MIKWFLFAVLFAAASVQAECPIFGEKKRAVIIYYRTSELLVVKGEGGHISGVGLIFNDRGNEIEVFELTPQAREGNWYDEEWGCIANPWNGVVENGFSLDLTVDTSTCPEENRQACLSTGRVRLGWLHDVTEIRYAKVFDEGGRPYRRLRIRYIN